MHSSGSDVGRQLGYNQGKSGEHVDNIVSAINYSFPDARRDLTRVAGYFSRRLKELRSYKSSEEDLAQRLEYFDKNSSHAVGNAAVAAKYAVSVMTFGLPQTIRHLRRVWREMEIYDRMRDKENVNLDILEFVGTGCLIALQVKAMYEVYSRLF